MIVFVKNKILPINILYQKKPKSQTKSSVFLGIRAFFLKNVLQKDWKMANSGRNCFETIFKREKMLYCIANTGKKCERVTVE